MTLSGTVVAGVEPGCRLLGGHQLVGSAAAGLREGMAVRVTGFERRSLMSHCQQGVPFVVTSVAEL